MDRSADNVTETRKGVECILDTIWCLILMNVFLSGLSIGWRCVTSTKMLNRLIPTRNVSMMKLLALPIIMCVC